MVEIEIPESERYDALPENLKELVKKALAEAISKYERRIIVLSGSENQEKYASLITEIISENLSNFLNKINILYVSETFEENTEWRNRYDNFISYFTKKDFISFKIQTYKKSVKVMGQTFEILILDMIKSLTPDDIGRLIGIVRGGGIIIILAPPMNSWSEIKTKFHEHLVTPPYELKDTKNRFLKRFIRKLYEHEGIYIYDIDKKEVIKGPVGKIDLDVTFPEYKLPKPPEEPIFHPKIYKLSVTQDQTEAIKKIEEIALSKDTILVLTADRGRGKSAAVGLGIAGLIGYLITKGKKKSYDIGITAPEFSNVKTLFEFLIRGLKVLKIEYDVVSVGKLKISGYPIYIEFKKPLELLNKKYDFVAVDEAAGININMLYRIVNKYKRIVFSSTIHGYEGAGRTFSVRFMKFLKEKTKLKILEFKMREPIRYSSTDPIEKWLFDTLVLDAEPAELTDKDLISVKNLRTKFYTPDLDKWFGSEEHKLKQFVGIYILAHYKNRPNDVAMIADAPHHDARVLELDTGKIVTAIQIAYEGNIPESTIKNMLKKYKPRGNVIPDVITKHYRRTDFAKLLGLRIVRIATHPQVQGKGLGSDALSKLFEQAKEEGYDWIGSGFGATEELLKFWQKNGFVIVHISPERNPVSGEYSVIVLRPLNERADGIIKEINYEFRWRFLNAITDVFFDITPELALRILKTPYEFKPHFNPILTETQWKRLKAYFTTAMTYEAAADVIRNISMYYFISTEKDKPELSEIEENILFSKIFLAWSFRKIANYFDMRIGKCRHTVKTASKKIYKWLKSKYSKE